MVLSEVVCESIGHLLQIALTMGGTLTAPRQLLLHTCNTHYWLGGRLEASPPVQVYDSKGHLETCRLATKCSFELYTISPMGNPTPLSNESGYSLVSGC